MERPDEQRAAEPSTHLAPVTYLPGAQAPGRSTPGRLTPRPTFAAIYDDAADDHAADESDSEEDYSAENEVTSDEPPAAPDRDAELARAEKVSMHALTRRGQSRRELERTLRSRDLSDEVITHEVDRLERVGLIDDVALAQNLVGILQERKGLGRTGIASELTRRLLSPAAIEYALELVDSGDELARARELAVKRAGQLSSYDRETAHRRLSGYLARRGYSGSTVRAAVEHALSESAGSRARGVRFR
jgi:regulatory protein